MKSIRFFAPAIAVLLLAFAMLACTKETIIEVPVKTDVAVIQTNAAQRNGTEEVLQPVWIKNPTGGDSLKAILFIPASDTLLPAVVVQHGCGGMWVGNDPASNNMASQFDTWVDSFRVHRMAALFIDSYSARNEDEFCGVVPPTNIPISGEFVRPRDAYEGLMYLRTQTTRINGNKVALLGFSHGGTSALATMVDSVAVAKASAWSYKTYNPTTTHTSGVLAPANYPAAGGFVAAVSYYPGASFFEYFGKPATPSDGKYVPYAPVLVHAAATDPLYTAQYTNNDDPNNIKQSAYNGLLQKAVRNGSSVANGNQMVLHVYSGAAHSFDGKTTGSDGTANALAKQRSLTWLEQFLRP
jgi:dienelactone hydrolase